MDDEFEYTIDAYVDAACRVAEERTASTEAAFIACSRQLVRLSRQRFGPERAFDLVMRLLRERCDRKTRRAIAAAWAMGLTLKRIDKGGAGRRGTDDDRLSVRSR